MRRRQDRTIEIFSLSSIDLFAAAMGAFALLAIVLLPFYQKEVQERTPDNAIADLARAAQDSQVKTEVQRKALEKKRAAMAANVSDIRSEAEQLLAQLKAAEAALKDKQAKAEQAVIVKEPVAQEPGPKPKKTVSTFRFLGMKTSQNAITIAVDLNKCMGGHEHTIQQAAHRIIDSLQDHHRLDIIGFQQTDQGPITRHWPASGALRPMTGNNPAEARQFSDRLTRQFGGSASMLDAFETILDGPSEAIFLISDGLPNPRANQGLQPDQLIRAITQRNGGRKEIHTVVVGNYFDYKGTVAFMETLAARNNGQFMALASGQTGVCD